VRCFRAGLTVEPPDGASFAVAAVTALGLLALGAMLFEGRRREVPDLA
jgi:ABC-type polysaccharide/polyol phosphate export permease